MSSTNGNWDPSYEWKVVTLMSLGMGLVGVDRFLIVPLMPVLAQQLHLDYQDLGDITGALALAWGASALFSGNLADRIGFRAVIIPAAQEFGCSTAQSVMRSWSKRKRFCVQAWSRLPRLLMLSGVGNAEQLRRYGIAVVSDLPGVGENLQDHCFIVGFVGQTKAPMLPSRAGSHLFFRSTRDVHCPDIQALLATSALGIAEVKPNEAFSIRLALVRPQSRGRIQITSAHPNAPLLIDPGYLSAEADLTALCTAIEHARAIGSAAGLSEWRKREIARIPRGTIELAEFVAQNVGSYWHPVGTCAMGLHEEAVVDPSLCVYGTSNLRVADASIMPTITGGNTNAPTIVIAERAAQMIVLRQTK